jgi:hypothetical protein
MMVSRPQVTKTSRADGSIPPQRGLLNRIGIEKKLLGVLADIVELRLKLVDGTNLLRLVKVSTICCSPE